MNTLPLSRSLLLLVCAGCAQLGGAPPTEHAAVDPFLGVYRGGFDSAATATPEDDLNHNPCSETRNDACLTHHAPLQNILLALERNRAGEINLAFYRDAAELADGRTLDLLGRGCGTRIGALQSLDVERDAAGSHRIATFPIDADNRLCLGKLRPVSRHHLRLELHRSGPDEPALARVVIDKAVRDDNYLYVEQDGVRRRVKIDLANTLHEDGMDRYRVCIEDDYGEYERCVLTDREFRSFVLPVPVPGGAALNYTWWQELQPRLRRTSGRFVVERYHGRFTPVQPSAEPSP